MASAVPAWWSPNQAVVRTKIKGNWHDGAVCASREATVSLTNILKWVVLAFIVWWVIESPGNAAHLVHNIGTFLSNAASGISRFASSI